jgi:hypothetical protein
MKRRLDEGLALGAPYEASARDLWCKLGELVEREVAVKIARETFPLPPLRLTKPKPADEIPNDKERNDERRAGDNRASLIHARPPQSREQVLSAVFAH